MFKKNLPIMIIIMLALIFSGCPKKTVVKETPSTKESEELVLERERARRLEAERAEKEKALKELEEKRAQALKELEAERERARRLEEEKKALEELEAKRAQALKELEAERERARRLEEERESKLREKEEALKREFEKSLIAKKTPGIEGEVFESTMLKDIHFDFDKYEIRPEDVEILKETARLLKRFPNVKIQIEGHCDERGTNEYNLALGERRANSAKNYLISLGISPERLSTISYGEERPLDPGHNEEAWAKNRRAHFVILSK